LIFNGGGGVDEHSKWRKWAVSAFAHNTVVVDGMAQTRSMNWDDPFHDPNMVSQGSIDAHWQTNELFDFASGVYDEGYGPSHQKIASQRRDVLFLKPDIYVVADRLHPNDSLPHRFQARWQVLTTHSEIDKSTQSLVTEDPAVPNVAIVPLLVDHLQAIAISGQEEPEILGWNFHTGGGPELVPATTLLQTLIGSGPRLILTLIVPLRSGERMPIARVERGKDGVSATAIFTDGKRLLISCPGTLGIAALETLPNGKVIRSVRSGMK
jgi:Heparinase II/III-like protein